MKKFKLLKFLLFNFLFSSLLSSPLTVSAKYTTGLISIGGSKDENKFLYISKFAYVPGDGSYSIRIKTLRPQHFNPTPNMHAKDGKDELNALNNNGNTIPLQLSIFLDEEWESRSIDTMQPICDRIKHARSTRVIHLKTGVASSEWSDWEKGGLKQVVRPHIWYFVLHNCNNVLPERTRLKFEFEAKQFDGSHYSSELEGLSTVYLAKLILFSLYLIYYIYLCKGYLNETDSSGTMDHTVVRQSRTSLPDINSGDDSHDVHNRTSSVSSRGSGRSSGSGTLGSWFGALGGDFKGFVSSNGSSSSIFSLKKFGNLHPVIWVLSTVIALQVVATSCEYSHLLIYSSNGVGLKGLTVMADILTSVSQVLIQSILILISLGWLVLQSSLGELDIVIPVIFILVIVNTMLTTVSHVQDDASYKYFSSEGWIGWCICIVRLTIWIWFSWACASTKKQAPTKMGIFLSKFWLAGSIYFLSYPVLFVITTQLFAAYLRHKFLILSLFISFACSVRWLEGLFLKKGEFYRVSALGTAGCLPGAPNLVKGE